MLADTQASSAARYAIRIGVCPATRAVLSDAAMTRMLTVHLFKQWPLIVTVLCVRVFVMSVFICTRSSARLCARDCIYRYACSMCACLCVDVGLRLCESECARASNTCT